MSIANKVREYLDTNHINYQLLQHKPSKNSLSSAIQAHIKTSQLVKAIMLEDLQGGKLMAILPASHKISLNALNTHFNRQFRLMKESHIYEFFEDCKHGAVPPLAQAYQIDRVYDEFLIRQDHLYLEAGDHISLIQLAQEEFKNLMQYSVPLKFSYRLFH
jgi:Ala-tRNA(Pro) deacylase